MTWRCLVTLNMMHNKGKALYTSNRYASKFFCGKAEYFKEGTEERPIFWWNRWDSSDNNQAIYTSERYAWVAPYLRTKSFREVPWRRGRLEVGTTSAQICWRNRWNSSDNNQAIKELWASRKNGIKIRKRLLISMQRRKQCKPFITAEPQDLTELFVGDETVGVNLLLREYRRQYTLVLTEW